jgi:hypothetical protein
MVQVFVCKRVLMAFENMDCVRVETRVLQLSFGAANAWSVVGCTIWVAGLLGG